MKEIEVKARIDNHLLVEENLKKLNCELSEPLTQKDIIYLRKEIDFPDIVKGNCNSKNKKL